LVSECWAKFVVSSKKGFVLKEKEKLRLPKLRYFGGLDVKVQNVYRKIKVSDFKTENVGFSLEERNQRNMIIYCMFGFVVREIDSN